MMKKKFLLFVGFLLVCFALVIPKTNALTLTESYEQSGGGGYYSVVTPFNKYLMFESNEEINVDSYETLIYYDSSNVFKIYEDSTYNVIGNPDGWNDTQDVSKTLVYNGTYIEEDFDIKLNSGDTASNKFYLEISSIVDVSTFSEIFSEFYLAFQSPYNDFVYNGDLTIQVKGKPTQNYDGDEFISFEQTYVEYTSVDYSESQSFDIVEHLAYYLELFDYYGVSVVDFYLEIYLEFEFELYYSNFDFSFFMYHFVNNGSFPYRPTEQMYLELYGGDIVEEVINPDFGSWLTSSLSGFMNFEIVDGWSFGIIFALIVAIPIVLYFLKYFFGG